MSDGAAASDCPTAPASADGSVSAESARGCDGARPSVCGGESVAPASGGTTPSSDRLPQPPPATSATTIAANTTHLDRSTMVNNLRMVCNRNKAAADPAYDDHDADVLTGRP